MNILLLIIAIILLVMYMAYLSRRKDFQLVKQPPKTAHLPRTKYDKALKELNEFRKQPKPKTRRQLMERNSELFYLERRLNQIQQEIEKEQKSYYLACKERELSWKDYSDYFDSLAFFEKFLSPVKLRELALLRKLYLDMEKKVERELSKFNAQTRVRYHEEKTIRDREDEIERNTQKSRQSAIPSEVASEETGQFIQEAFEEISLHEESPEKPEIEEEDETPAAETASETPPTADPVRSSVRASGNNRHFGQEDLLTQYPDFSGISYIDETFSMVEAGKNAIIDADFSHAYFVSVVFKDRHQYKNCTFDRSDFSYSAWQRAEGPHRMINCNFRETRFSFSRFEYTAFYGCRFIESDFQDVQLKMVKFVNCSFEDCLLIDVDFSETVMSSDMLKTIDFSLCAKPPRNSGTDNSANGQPERSPISPNAPGGSLEQQRSLSSDERKESMEE